MIKGGPRSAASSTGKINVCQSILGDARWLLQAVADNGHGEA